MCIGLFSFQHHCIKQIDSMLLWVCAVIDHRRRQKCGKNISDDCRTAEARFAAKNS